MSMVSTRRRTVGIALGALALSPFIALLASPAASAEPDDLSFVGPLSIDGFTDTFAYNASTSAIDNLVLGSSNLVPFDLDTFLGTPESGDVGLVFTIPLVYQGGFEDIGGTFTPISTFDSADFLNPDQGLIELGGTPPASLAVESINLSSILGYNDIFSINTGTFAIDNYVDGISNGLPFDLDIASGGSDVAAYEAVFTIPALFQAGIEDIGGVITPLFSINPADFVSPDLGLSLIGG
jgi:hypothetical protein